MALKIRLRQHGRRNLSVYRLVLSDVRSPRDGKYLEMLGWYDPLKEENNMSIHSDRILHWLNHGATLTEKAAALIKKSAPELFAEYQRKQLKAKEKVCTKKKELRKKKETITA